MYVCVWYQLKQQELIVQETLDKATARLLEGVVNPFDNNNNNNNNNNDNNTNNNSNLSNKKKKSDIPDLYVCVYVL